jgi:hypothetical protein
MKSTNIFTCLSLVLIFTAAANADAAKDKKKVIKPVQIYWADGYNRKGKPEELEIDTGKMDMLVPVLIKECVKTPHEIFWKVVKMKPLSPFA